MGLAVVSDDEGDNSTGKIDIRGGLLNVSEDRGAGIGKRTGSEGIRVKGEVERKPEFKAHGGNAADDVGPVNGTAIPSIGGEHGSFDPDKGRAAVGAGDGDGFVQISKEAFDTDGLVVAVGSGVEANTKESAGIGKNTAKSAACVDNNEATHTDFQEDLLEQDSSQLMGMGVGNGNADNKLGEIAHGGEEITIAGVGNGGTGAPKVTVEDKHGSSDGPTEKYFTVTADALVGKYAVRTFFDPFDNIETAAWPEEAHADSEECLVSTKVAANGTAKENIKNKAAEQRRHNDEEKGVARLEALPDDDAAMMET
jgi:hypothetical protein